MTAAKKQKPSARWTRRPSTEQVGATEPGQLVSIPHQLKVRVSSPPRSSLSVPTVAIRLARCFKDRAALPPPTGRQARDSSQEGRCPPLRVSNNDDPVEQQRRGQALLCHGMPWLIQGNLHQGALPPRGSSAATGSWQLRLGAATNSEDECAAARDCIYKRFIRARSPPARGRSAAAASPSPCLFAHK